MAGKWISVLLNPFSFTSDTNITEIKAFQASNLLEGGQGRGLKKFQGSMGSDTLCQALMPPHAALTVTVWADISLYHS